jgi:hypothetical protein
VVANGSALSWRGGLLFGGGIDSAWIEPGDSIVVPVDLERVPWLKEAKDIATILGQFAWMGGVIFAVFR